MPRAVTAPAILALLVGCLYDPDNRCSPGQVLRDMSCHCPAGQIPTPQGRCEPCAEGERAVLAQCVCKIGYQRDASGRCQAAFTGLGEPCDPIERPCRHSPVDHCMLTQGNTGYCTLGGCASNDDCPPDHECQATGDGTTACARPPTGQFEGCVTAADCAAFDADYCEAAITHVCLVDGCAERNGFCHGDWLCCQYDVLNNSLCVPPEALVEGRCPGPGVAIEEQAP